MEIDDSWLVEIRSDGGRVTPQERGHCDAKIKRLEVGCFQNQEPIPGAAQISGSAGIELSVTDLALILNGIDLATARRRKRYSRVG
jgi:hypothetical protein